MNELALFTGAGGGLLGSKILGWSTVCAVEIERYPREVLLQRQRDGFLEKFPVWDDVCTFDGRPWRGIVDVVSGGFPCQDISGAGKGKGLAGARSGLWFEYLRIIKEAMPRFVFAENSPMLRTRGLGTIIQGLTSLGYDVRWGVLGAWHVGANHRRNRMWVVARHINDKAQMAKEHVAYAVRERRQRVGPIRPTIGSGWSPDELKRLLKHEREMAVPAGCGGRVAHRVASRVDRLKAIGNGQVPLVAATAWDLLTHDFIR